MKTVKSYQRLKFRQYSVVQNSYLLGLSTLLRYIAHKFYDDIILEVHVVVSNFKPVKIVVQFSFLSIRGRKIHGKSNSILYGIQSHEVGKFPNLRH